jgi:hypothetical protein
VGHAFVDGAFDRHDHDFARSVGRGGHRDAGQAEHQRRTTEDQAQAFHVLNYPRAREKLRRGKRVRLAALELVQNDLTHDRAVGLALELRHDQLHQRALVALLGR